MANVEIRKERTSMELLEYILDDKNLFEAYKQVYKNKGTSGIDGITVEELGVYMYDHKEEIKDQIRKLQYKPNPVRRVEIPKENGKTRKLGIPTVVDRLIQQAMVQISDLILEPLLVVLFCPLLLVFQDFFSFHSLLVSVLFLLVVVYIFCFLFAIIFLLCVL